MSNGNKSDTVVGTKTGVMRRTTMQLDGPERDTHRTGTFKRESQPFSRDEDAEQRREPQAPPTLPEVNDDGGTTGLVNFDAEGNDSARREDHPS
jgi:hypothetical protein